jgi:hypothetical protein
MLCACQPCSGEESEVKIDYLRVKRRKKKEIKELDTDTDTDTDNTD